jgi:hypothetical protein
MTRLELLGFRTRRIITIPEFMVIYNFHFQDWQEFQNFVKIRKPRLRELYKSGFDKMLQSRKIQNQN